MMSTYCIAKNLPIRVIFMEDHIPLRTDRSQVLGRQTSKLSLWDVVFHENNSNTNQINKKIELFLSGRRCQKKDSN